MAKLDLKATLVRLALQDYQGQQDALSSPRPRLRRLFRGPVESLDRLALQVPRESPGHQDLWDLPVLKGHLARKENLALLGPRGRKVTRVKRVCQGRQVTLAPWGWQDRPVQGGSLDLQVDPALRGKRVL